MLSARWGFFLPPPRKLGVGVRMTGSESGKVKSGEQECSPYTENPATDGTFTRRFLTIEPFGMTNGGKDERWGSVLRG